jgi:hypothetical protein
MAARGAMAKSDNVRPHAPIFAVTIAINSASSKFFAVITEGTAHGSTPL